MGVYRTDPAVLASYARARYLTGEQLLTAHRSDPAGRCAGCARPAPCPSLEFGEQLCRDHGDWAPQRPLVLRSLVRPYVLADQVGRRARR